MKYKQMRRQLKEKGVKPIPLKNTEMYELYIKEFPDYDGGDPGQSLAVKNDKTEVGNKDNTVKLVSSNIYTYIGSGDTPPHMITFMGIQNFVRGEATEVTDELVLSKIVNHKSFVKGKYDMEKAFEADKIEAKKSQNQRDEDVKFQIEMERKNKR